MPALTLYGRAAAATTLPLAGALTSTGGGSSTTTRATLIGQKTGYGEIAAQGTAVAWPALDTLLGATGRGFLWDVTTLELQQVLSGSWTPTFTLATSTGSVTADLYCRVWLCNGGVFVPITPATGRGILLTGQTITTTPTAFVFPATVLPPNAAGIGFLAGAKLYLDLWANITGNTTGSDAATLSLTLSSTTSGIAGCQIVTPGYQTLSASQRAAMYTFGPLCLNDGVNYLTVERDWSFAEVKGSIFQVEGQPGGIASGYRVGEKSIPVTVRVLGNGHEDVRFKLDALEAALALREQKLMLSRIDQRYRIANATKAPAQFGAGAPNSVSVPITFVAANPYPYANYTQSYTDGPTVYSSVVAGLWQRIVQMQVAGTATSYPVIVITNNTAPNTTTLTANIVSGNVYTSLAVNALPSAVVAGDTYLIGTGANQLSVVASANVPAGGTSIPVNSFTAAHTWNAGSAVARSIALTKVALYQNTLGTQLVVDTSASALQLSQNDSLTITCDPFVTNGLTVLRDASTTPLAYSFSIPKQQAGANNWTIQASCGSVPTLTAQFTWTPRYQC